MLYMQACGGGGGGGGGVLDERMYNNNTGVWSEEVMGNKATASTCKMFRTTHTCIL